MACFGMMRRVAIIGGGPAGLSMADQLAAINARAPAFSVTLFERRTGFGGVWTYDADPGNCDVRFDRHGRAHALWGGRKDGDDAGRFCPPGPMYDGLRTNLPCDIMTYRSHPYPPQTPLFPSRQMVEKYIVDFANTLEPIDTRLATAVQSVRRVSHDPTAAAKSIGAGSKWAVRSIDTTTGVERDEEFDCVVLASGRCNTPSIPFVKGLWDFQGTVMHSAWWRSPVPFAGRTVLVVGNSSSGSDIARELAGYILRTLPEATLQLATTSPGATAIHHAFCTRMKNSTLHRHWTTTLAALILPTGRNASPSSHGSTILKKCRVGGVGSCSRVERHTIMSTRSSLAPATRTTFPTSTRKPHHSIHTRSSLSLLQHHRSRWEGRCTNRHFGRAPS